MSTNLSLEYENEANKSKTMMDNSPKIENRLAMCVENMQIEDGRNNLIK